MKIFCYCLLLMMLPVTILAQSTPRVIPLWEKGAPGFESRKDLPEESKDCCFSFVR